LRGECHEQILDHHNVSWLAAGSGTDAANLGCQTAATGCQTGTTTGSRPEAFTGDS